MHKLSKKGESLEFKNKKDNVILIALYDLDSFAVRTLHPVLREAGFNVNSVFFKRLNPNNTMDHPSVSEINRLIKLIKESGPVLVGISVRSANFKLACKITEEIKRELNTLVIWGGVHSTIRPHQCLEFADIVCIGEGEGAIVELARQVSKDAEIDKIENLWIKKGSEIIKNDLRPIIQDLDSVPFTDFSNESKYLVENGVVLPLPDPGQRTSYGLMTSRGCPFSCTYCCNNVLVKIYAGKGKYVRRRSVENVIEELVRSKERFKNLASIFFSDDVFTFDADWIKRFCVQYKKAVNLPFYCYCHPKATNDEMVQLLKDAGVSGMTMGIQSGSEETRHKCFERYDTNEEIVRSAKILHKYQISCSYDLIMDNPLETSENKRETFNLLLRLPKPFELHTHTQTHFPETKLTNLLLGKGIISKDDIEDQKQESYNRWTPTLDLKRNKENLFWDNLYYLAKKKYVPRRFVIWLSHSNLLKSYPKPLTLLLRFLSPSIHTVRRGSKIDTIRCYLMMSFSNPRLLFEKKARIFIWAKIKEKLCLRSLVINKNNND